MTVELEEFEKIEVNGTEALFTNRRVFESEIPNGLFRYDLRGSDETGRFCAMISSSESPAPVCLSHTKA